jgi:hypothetical protein
MSQMVLEFHGWRNTKPDDDNELKVLFLFSLQTEAERLSGGKLDHTKTFWTEARLSRDLAARGRWAALSKAERIKALYVITWQKIQEAGRKLREVPVFWTATSPLRDGPVGDEYASVSLKPEVMIFDAPVAPSNSVLETRKAAGLAG